MGSRCWRTRPSEGRYGHRHGLGWVYWRHDHWDFFIDEMDLDDLPAPSDNDCMVLDLNDFIEEDCINAITRNRRQYPSRKSSLIQRQDLILKQLNSKRLKLISRSAVLYSPHTYHRQAPWVKHTISAKYLVRLRQKHWWQHWWMLPGPPTLHCQRPSLR